LASFQMLLSTFASFNVPISIISIVDHYRIWFKSHHGLGVKQVDREPGLCASAILRSDPHTLIDASKEGRSLANPLVAGDFGLRFYAGVSPIHSCSPLGIVIAFRLLGRRFELLLS
jgi:hypothetical protein